MSSLTPNPNVPQVPTPVADLNALAYFGQAVKQVLDSLSGFRGNLLNRAVTFNDLIRLQVLNQAVALGVLAPGTSIGTDGAITSAPAAEPYFLQGYTGAGTLAANQIIFAHRMPVKTVFPANLAPVAILESVGVGTFTAMPTSVSMSSWCNSLVTATASTVLNVQSCLSAADPTVGGNWTTVGTMTFGVGGHAATLATSGGLSLVYSRGDYMRLVAPGTPDATLAEVLFSLVGTR